MSFIASDLLIEVSIQEGGGMVFFELPNEKYGSSRGKTAI
jgi:hypothetical protein